MSASIEQLSNIIYTGELSCLIDYAFEYSSLDLNRSLALVIKRVCAEAEAEDYTDSTVLLDNTIPSLVEFTLLRRCPREEASSVYDVLVAAVEMVSIVTLQNKVAMCRLRDLIFLNTHRSMSSSFAATDAYFLSIDQLGYLKMGKDGSTNKEIYRGFFSTYGLAETIICHGKSIHFWIEDWESICGQHRLCGHYIRVYIKSEYCESDMDKDVAPPDADSLFEWRCGCVIEYLGDGTQRYLVELDARSEDEHKQGAGVISREQFTLDLRSMLFHFDDKSNIHRLVDMEEGEIGRDEDGDQRNAVINASCIGTDSDTSRLVRLPPATEFSCLNNSNTVIRSRYYFDLLNLYYTRNGFCNAVTSLKRPAITDSGSMGVSVDTDVRSLCDETQSEDSPPSIPTRKISGSASLAGISCLDSHLCFLQGTHWTLRPAFVYAQLVEFSEAVVVVYGRMGDSDFRAFQIEKFSSFMLHWSELFVILSDRLVAQSPTEHMAETRRILRKRGSALATELYVTLIVSMLKCSIITKRYLGISLLRELILLVAPEIASMGNRKSKSKSALKNTVSDATKSPMSLANGLSFDPTVLEMCLVKLEILLVLFTNKYSNAYNSEFLGNADIILKFLLHRKRINTDELKLLWGALKVLSDNSGQHIVYKFLLALCPHLNDSLVLTIIQLIRTIPSSDVDEQYLTFIQSFAVLLVRHFRHLNDMKVSQHVDFSSMHQSSSLRLNNNSFPFGVDILYEFLLDQPLAGVEGGSGSSGSFADDCQRSNASESSRLSLYHTATVALVELVQSVRLRTTWHVVLTTDEESYLHSFYELLVESCVVNIQRNDSVALSMRLLMHLIVSKATNAVSSSVGSSPSVGNRKFASITSRDGGQAPLRWFRCMLMESNDNFSGVSSSWNVESSACPSLFSASPSLLRAADGQTMSTSILSLMGKANLLDLTIAGLEKYHEQAVCQICPTASSAVSATQAGTATEDVPLPVSPPASDINSYHVQNSKTLCKLSYQTDICVRLEFLRFLLFFSGLPEEKSKLLSEPNTTSPIVQLTLRHLTTLWVCLLQESISFESSVAFLGFMQELTVLENRELAQLLFMYSKDTYVSKSCATDSFGRCRISAADKIVRTIVPPYLLSNPLALFGVSKQANTNRHSAGLSAGMFAPGVLDKMFADYFSPYLLRDNYVRARSGKCCSMSSTSLAAALSFPRHLFLVSLNLFLYVNMAQNNIVFTNYGMGITTGGKMFEHSSWRPSEFSVSPTSASWIRTGKLVQLQLLWKVVVDADANPHCEAVSEFGQSLLLELHHRCVGKSLQSGLKVHRYFIVMCFNHLAYAIQSIDTEGAEEAHGNSYISPSANGCCSAGSIVPLSSSHRISRRISLYISLLQRYIERFQLRLVYEVTVRCIPAVSTHSLAVHKDKLPYFSLTFNSSDTIMDVQRKVARHLALSSKEEDGSKSAATNDTDMVTGELIVLSKMTTKAVSARTVMDKFSTWIGKETVRSTDLSSVVSGEELQGDFRQYNFAKLEKVESTVAEAGLTPISEWKRKNVLLYGKKPAPAVVAKRLSANESADAALASVLAATAPDHSASGFVSSSESICYAALTAPLVSQDITTSSNSSGGHKKAHALWDAYVMAMDSVLGKLGSLSAHESHWLSDILAIGMEALGLEVQTQSDYVQQLLVLLDGFLSVHGQQTNESVSVDKSADMVPVGCVAVEASAWNLLNFFPTSGSILYVQVSELTPHSGGDDLCIILRQISAPYQMLYTLNIISSLLSNPSEGHVESTTASDVSNSWMSKFVQIGGVDVLVEVLIRLCEFITADDMQLFSGDGNGNCCNLRESNTPSIVDSGCCMHRANAYISNVAFVCRHLHKCLLLDPDYSRAQFSTINCNKEQSGCGCGCDYDIDCHLACSLPVSNLVGKVCMVMDCVLSAYNRTASTTIAGMDVGGSFISKDCVQGLLEHGWTLLSGLCMMTPPGHSSSHEQNGVRILGTNADIVVRIVCAMTMLTDDGMKAVGCRALYFVGQQFAENCVKAVGAADGDGAPKTLDISHITLEPLDLDETNSLSGSRPGSTKNASDGSRGWRKSVAPQANAIDLFYLFYAIVIASGSAVVDSSSSKYLGNMSGFFTLVRELREFCVYSKHSMYLDGNNDVENQHLVDNFVDYRRSNDVIMLPEDAVWTRSQQLCISDTCVCQMLMQHLGKLALSAQKDYSWSQWLPYGRYINRSTYLHCDRRVMGTRDSLTPEYATEVSIIAALNIFQLLLEETVYSSVEDAKQFRELLDKMMLRVNEGSCATTADETGSSEVSSGSITFVEFLFSYCLFRKHVSTDLVDDSPCQRDNDNSSGRSYPLIIRLANRQKVYALLMQLTGNSTQYHVQLLRTILKENYNGCGMSTYPFSYTPIDPDIKTFRVLGRLSTVTKVVPRQTSISTMIETTTAAGSICSELSLLTRHAGLINQANTCYMNSFLQQLYHVRGFTDQLLAIDIAPTATATSSNLSETNATCACPLPVVQSKYIIPYRYNVNQYASLATVMARATTNLSDNEKVLVQMQFLFAQLRMNSQLALDTGGFCGVFLDYSGEPISIFEQKDINEFAGMLFDKLENSVRIPITDDGANTTAATSYSSPVLSLLSNMFGGKICCTIRSTVSDYKSNSSENFYMLSCEVKGFDTLDESLAAFTKAETLEGDERVEDDDGVRVAAVRRYSIGQLPSTLIIHLKRFEFVLATMSRKKVNDRLSFPMQLNMYKYTTGALEGAKAEMGSELGGDCLDEYEYHLRGVVLHAGAIDRGHYYSYIQEREAPYHWYKFNDSRVSLFDEENIPDACFGGLSMPKESTPSHQSSTGSSQGFSTDSSKPPEMKIENAYMLFYEKVPVQPKVPVSSVASRNNLALCPLLWRNIERQQALYLRDVFLFNEAHFQFMHQLLQSCPVPTASASPTSTDVAHSSVSLMLFQQYITVCFKFVYHTVLWAHSTSCLEPFAKLLELDVRHSTDLCEIYAYTLVDLLRAVDTVRPPTNSELCIATEKQTDVATVVSERFLCKYNSWWLMSFRRSPLLQNVASHVISLLKRLISHAKLIISSRVMDANMLPGTGVSNGAVVELCTSVAPDMDSKLEPREEDGISPPSSPPPAGLLSLCPELLALDRSAFAVHNNGVKAGVVISEDFIDLSVLDQALHILISCIECMFFGVSDSGSCLVELTDLLLELVRAEGTCGECSLVLTSLVRIGAVRRLVIWLLHRRPQARSNTSLKISSSKRVVEVLIKLVVSCRSIESTDADNSVKSQNLSASSELVPVAVLSDVDLTFISSPAIIALLCEQAQIKPLQTFVSFLCHTDGGTNATRALNVLKAIKDAAIRGWKQVGDTGSHTSKIGSVNIAPIGKCVRMICTVVTSTTSVVSLYTREPIIAGTPGTCSVNGDCNNNRLDVTAFTSIMNEFIENLDLSLHIVFKADSDYMDAVLGMLTVLAGNSFLDRELTIRCKYRRTELLQYLGRSDADEQ